MEQFLSIKKSKGKKGQIWSFDLVVATIIFLFGLLILFYYAINLSSQSKDKLDEFFYEGNLASELILSEVGVGILSDNKVNQTKLENFDALSDNDKRNFLGLNFNFYFSINNMKISGVPRNYVGILNTTEVDNLIQTTRLTIYENKPVKFQLFVWK
ncbi:MAG: hypothetical protein KKF48_00305 [Nanoarchaeota archaeon]|nr:hypothetical protein [Nanoarchaeota archaeon]MBU1027466.1 hypothetical protein [Nanoarchaeota archaeon]